MSAIRVSPLHDRLAQLRPLWGDVNRMATPIRFFNPEFSTPGLPTPVRFREPGELALQLTDLSALQRVGLKGPRAADWLRARAVSVPQQPNTWSTLDGGGLVARLGRTEFLVEDGLLGDTAPTLRTELGAGAPGVYAVLRQDAALLVRGAASHELFAQTCNVNFAAIPPQEQAAILTMMVGVAVTVINTSLSGDPTYRIWCDGTFGVYLWDTLLGIAAELGGGPVGLAIGLPEAADRLGRQ